MRRLALPLVLAAGACASANVAPPAGAVDPAPIAAQPAAPAEPPSSLHAMAFARRSAAAGDAAGRVAHLETAARLAPNDPVVIRELARAHAASADTARVLELLDRLAGLGSLRDPVADSAFAFLHADPRVIDAALRIRDGSVPVVRSVEWARVPDADLVPESIAHDAADGALYVGSMGRRSIVRRGADGSVATLVAAGADGLGEVIGIRVHPTRRELWVNSFARDTAAPGWMGRTGGWVELRRYALPGGALLERHPAPDPSTPHLFNDLAIAADGTVYVTDSHGAAVYRLADGRIERWFEGGAGFLYPNGIALSPDAALVYVAHADGILVVEARTGAAAPLATASGALAARIDGLYLHRGRLVGIQRVDDYERVVALTLSADGRRADAVEVLERRHPGYDAPTTGVVVGDTLLYIANSQLGRLGEDGAVEPRDGAPGTLILALPLR